VLDLAYANHCVDAQVSQPGSLTWMLLMAAGNLRSILLPVRIDLLLYFKQAS